MKIKKRNALNAVSLCDDVVALILDYVTDPEDRTSFSEVCKQWLRVEGLSRSEIRIIGAKFIPRILPRFPNLIVFQASSKLITNAHLTLLAQTCPKLEHVDLNVDRNKIRYRSFPPAGDEGLRALANGCTKLSTLMLRGRKKITSHGVISLLNSNTQQNLTHLDLGYCRLIKDVAVEAVAKLRSLSVLILEKCPFITDVGIGFLCNNASCTKTLKKLVLAHCHRITDSGLSELHKMSCLEELDLTNLRGPHHITDHGGGWIAPIQTLKRLNLSGQVKMTDVTIYMIALYCLDLEVLSVEGCRWFTRYGFDRAFSDHKNYESLAVQIFQ